MNIIVIFFKIKKEITFAYNCEFKLLTYPYKNGLIYDFNIIDIFHTDMRLSEKNILESK